MQDKLGARFLLEAARRMIFQTLSCAELKYDQCSSCLKFSLEKMSSRLYGLRNDDDVLCCLIWTQEVLNCETNVVSEIARGLAR